jgi:hypothetical protein
VLFIPYMIMDLIFMIAALFGCFAGFATTKPGERTSHMFQISFVFLIMKIYIELCVSSRYRCLLNKSHVISRENSVNDTSDMRGQSDV